MVMFKRIAPRIYADPAFQGAKFGQARIAYIAQQDTGADEIDPTAALRQGCIAVFPTLKKPEDFLKTAVGQLDKVNTRQRARVVLFTTSSLLRTPDMLFSDGPGASVDPTNMRFGAPGSSHDLPTGNGLWQFYWGKSGLKVGPDFLQIEVAVSDKRAGLQLTSSQVVPFAPGETIIELPLTGNDRGLWRFATQLNASHLSTLGVGPRYFKARPIPIPNNVLLDHAAYPLLDFANSLNARFVFEIDCTDPYDAGDDPVRSRLLPPSTPLPTHLHSVQGHRLFMAPAQGAQRGILAFMRAPTRFTTTGGAAVLDKLEHHLAPFGAFGLEVEEKNASTVRLALGASNLESVEVRLGSSGDLLQFASGAALVVDDETPPLDAFTSNQPGVPLADVGDLCRTSWLGIGPDRLSEGRSRLSLDPEGMQTYATDGDLMAFRPSRPPFDGQSLPWVPALGLGGVTGGGSTELKIEREFLSRARRKLLVPPSLKAFQVGDPPSTTETGLRTPQGYEAKRSDKGWLTEVTFGRTGPRDSLVRGTERPDFGLVPIKGTQGEAILAELMATNRLFVATRLSKLIAFFDPACLNRIYMADWRAGWGKSSHQIPSDPYLVLKHDNRSVETLLADEAQWTNDTGPLALTGAERDDLRKIVAQALKMTGPLYEPIKTRLTSPNWSGLVSFGFDLNEMPAQLGALETLVDDPLPIHHVGIDLSAIETSANSVWKTSVFGLIDYTALPNAPFKPEQIKDLQLRINELKLLVENDVIRSFSCRVQTNIKTFLETNVKPPKTDLILIGRYESRIAPDGERRDNYALEAEGSLVLDFDDDAFLRQVELTRVAMVTEVRGGVKYGKLLVDGALKFNEIKGGLDLLGLDRVEFFDLGVGFGPKGSLFDLKIDFPNLRLDLEGFNRRRDKNGPRSGSFLSKLPIKLRGFRFGSFSLPKIGYFDFKNIAGVTLEHDFRMALDFDVDLGSLGALAKKLERFKLNLLIGWTPAKIGTSLPKLAFGFRIDAGEGGGGIDLGIEGIIKLTAEHFRLSQAKTADGRELVVLGAANARMKLLSVEIPSKQANFSFWLFAPMAMGSPLAEKLGWYARVKDKKPEPPVAIESFALGQRVLMNFGEVKTVRETLDWLEKQQEFQTDEEFIRFAGGAGSTLTYAPNREWFVAMSGTFFELVKLRLLLRDPDLYGIYFELLGQTDLSVDLLYQKLADGVGRYAGELMLPAALRNMDFGAVAITLGAIRFEVYTNGGFLVDLGFPDHVDYSRSFVVQGGPFIGKGGFYIGLTPREALPKIPSQPFDKIFRIGFALRIGLGREVEKGPLRASLSVSVYGRLEGAIARISSRALASAGQATPALAGSGYYIWAQGEIGIILEIEGRVDLKLVQARVLVRAWIGAGVTFETGQPIVLHGIAGIHVSVEVVIGRIKVFGKTIKITVRVGYSTELRYEWVLPARFPSRFAAAPRQITRGWTQPNLKRLLVAPVPFELKLLVDVSRSIDPGGQAAPRAVLIPSALLIADNAPGAAQPLKMLGEALVHWAVRELKFDPATVWLRRAENQVTGDLDVALLRAKLADIDTMPLPMLEQLFAILFAGATIDIAFGDPPGTPIKDKPKAQTVDAFVFPIPPGLRLRVGARVYDFAQEGLVSETEIAKIVADLDRQFAQQSPARSKARARAGQRPMLEHFFHNWCELFALTALDTMQNAWPTADNRVQLSALIANWDWQTAAARTGRTFHAGLRVAAPAGSVSLLQRAGLILDVPAQDVDIAIDGMPAGSWLSAKTGTIKLLSGNARLIGTTTPVIDAEVTQPKAVHVLPRSFLLPPFEKLTHLAGGARFGLLNPLGEDLQSQLHRITRATLPPLEHKARATNLRDGEEVPEHDLGAVPSRALVFDMAVELVQRGAGAAGPEPVADCLHIAGSSEAERRPLDALLSDAALVEDRLRGAGLYLAIQGAAPGDLEIMDAATAGVMLARTTVSVERRPGQLRFAAGVGTPDEDNDFVAPGTNLVTFLRLLQRAAIVNSGGTYLLLPPSSPLFARVQATKAARISIIIKFDAAAPLPVRAVNAVLVTDAADQRVLEQLDGDKQRRLAIRSAAQSPASDQASLFETVSLREPGSALLRVWRDKPADAAPQDPPTPEECAAHLAALFDMLEFGVERGGNVLLDRALCVPLASEEALPSLATKAQTDDVEADLPLSRTARETLRYDALVPIWKLLTPANANPYAAVGTGAFKVTLGWRDIYGNRLELAGKDEDVHLCYQDALLPVSAWPGVQAFVTVGGKASTLGAKFTFSLPTTTDPKEQEDWRRQVRAVVHQLTGPGVTLSLRSSLGKVGSIANFPRELVKRLTALAEGQNPVALSFDVPITLDSTNAHLEIGLELVIERDTALCDPAAPDDVRAVASPLKLRRKAAQGQDPESAREKFEIATEFRDMFKSHWAALGTTDAGSNAWWAIDQRLIPAARGAAPLMYGQPPLARAPMNAAGVDYPALQADGSVLSLTRDGLDLDSDVLMTEFLTRMDRILAPPLATRVSRVAAPTGARTPFERIMDAKNAMLSARGSHQLLRHVQPVYRGTPDQRGAAARRALREACASQLARFSEVASVIVQPLSFAADTPVDWFSPGDEDAMVPKIYGRLRFGPADTKGDKKINAIRALNHGIPLRGLETELAFTVLPSADADPATANQVDLTDQVAFQVTHVEREVVGLGKGALHEALAPAPAPSRWLTIVPIDRVEPLPLIDISQNKAVVAPAPVRRLPAAPIVAEPRIRPDWGNVPPVDYGAAIRETRQWVYQFTLGGMEGNSDEACCRFIYNAGVGADRLPPVESAAEPLFENVLRPLVAFDASMASLWPHIESAAGPVLSTHFDRACALFADMVDAVVQGLAPVVRLHAPSTIDEDRFVVSWNANLLKVAFVDHVPQSNGAVAVKAEPERPPLAGNGAPEIGLAIIGAPAQKKKVNANYWTTFSVSKLPHTFDLSVEPMDAMELQSIWAAASIRRNALINNKEVSSRFVYRTAEVYLQEALVPDLHQLRAIPMGARPQETLAQRLEAALAPIFLGSTRKVPTQIKLGLESVRLATVTESAGASAADRFIAEPDPKVQLVRTLGPGDESALAALLAAKLQTIFAREPYGKPEDVRLVLSVIARTEENQPILEIGRILIPLDNLAASTRRRHPPARDKTPPKRRDRKKVHVSNTASPAKKQGEDDDRGDGMAS